VWAYDREMTDPRDPVTATLRWQFRFAADAGEHDLVYQGRTIPIRQIDASTAEVELLDVEMSGALYAALAGPDAQVRFSASASPE
jgi:hypothetical protein